MPTAQTATKEASSSTLRAGLDELIGRSSTFNTAQDPVNLSMIRRWCDIIGDQNPVYTDRDAAAGSRHGSIVAPPAMLDVWDKPGLHATRNPNNPQSAALTLLEAAGYTSTVAVNSGLSFDRYLREGDLLHSTLTLEAVSDQKQTALGTGHFVTSRIRYYDADDEQVGSVLFRVLKFAPGTGRTPRGDDTAPAVDADPSRRPRPAINRDNQYFWDGARLRELRIQTCNACGLKAFPPMPRCSECGSFDRGYIVASGRATLYALALPHYPQAPGFDYPVPVGLVELEEGTRLVTNIVGCDHADMEIGMALEVCWLDSHEAQVEGATDASGSITLPQFRPAAPSRRESTLAVGEVGVGDRLPTSTVEITPTLIIGGALHTVDYFDGHHDAALARKRGSADIFMNIHTSLGLMQRYVSDWAGPDAVWRSLDVRLGAPNYPGDIMRLRGEVTEVDAASGHITVSFRGTNRLGDHVGGTAVLDLGTNNEGGQR